MCVLPALAHADITTGLVGWWKLDDSGGAVDSSGQGNNGTLHGTSFVGSCKVNGCRQFNGTSDYISVANGGGLANLQTGTIAMWVKWSGIQINSFNGYGSILGRQKNGFFTNQIIELDSNTPATARIFWKPYGTGSAIISNASPGDGVWVHLVISYTSGSHKMYINGVQDNIGNQVGTINADNTTALTIGAWIGDGHGYLGGNLDDVRVYNRVLTAGDVTELYNYTGAAVGRIRINGRAHIVGFHVKRAP